MCARCALIYMPWICKISTENQFDLEKFGKLKNRRGDQLIKGLTRKFVRNAHRIS